MIRELRKADINQVADIWLDTNIKAHYFIPAQYWKSNLELVKELLLQATVYVYEDNQKIQGFIGLNGEYIEGIFVSEAMQSQSIGKILLNYVKNTRSKLILNVYQKTHQQYLFIKEKDLKFSTAAWMKLPGKKIIEWRGSRSKNTVFQTVIETQNPVKDGVLLCLKRKSGKRFTLHSQTFTLN